jgi:hypothetical protein
VSTDKVRSLDDQIITNSANWYYQFYYAVKQLINGGKTAQALGKTSEYRGNLPTYLVIKNLFWYYYIVPTLFLILFYVHVF